MKDQKSMIIFFDNYMNKLDNVYEHLSQEINLSNLISKIYLKFFNNVCQHQSHYLVNKSAERKILYFLNIFKY